MMFLKKLTLALSLMLICVKGGLTTSRRQPREHSSLSYRKESVLTQSRTSPRGSYSKALIPRPKRSSVSRTSPRGSYSKALIHVPRPENSYLKMADDAEKLYGKQGATTSTRPNISEAQLKRMPSYFRELVLEVQKDREQDRQADAAKKAKAKQQRSLVLYKPKPKKRSFSLGKVWRGMGRGMSRFFRKRSKAPTSKKFPTHYDILGLKSSATLRDIKKAYRKRSRVVHPDRNLGNLNKGAKMDKNEAQEKFDELCRAYKVLSNKSKRKSYDWAIRTA